MYVFKDFNRAHARDISLSSTSYGVILTVLFWGGYAVVTAPTLVALTLAGLLLAHIVRIVQIVRSRQSISLQATHMIVLAVVVLAIVILAAYGCANAARFAGDVAALLALAFFPLFLASHLSVWVDFLAAHLIIKAMPCSAAHRPGG
jgi:hypothetical protein